MLSASCKYGIRAAVYLAERDKVDQDYMSIRIISEDLDISFHFLTKILQNLSQAALLNSYRGPRGGVALARPATEIPLIDIVVSIDGRGMFSECVLGLPSCREDRPCPLHDRWAEERNRLADMFSRTRLSDLVIKKRDKR